MDHPKPLLRDLQCPTVSVAATQEIHSKKGLLVCRQLFFLAWRQVFVLFGAKCIFLLGTKFSLESHLLTETAPVNVCMWMYNDVRICMWLVQFFPCMLCTVSCTMTSYIHTYTHTDTRTHICIPPNVFGMHYPQFLHRQYVCMYVCMYECIFVCMCVFMYICICNVCMYVCIYIYIYIYIYINVRSANRKMHAYMRTCMYAYYEYLYIQYRNTCIHTHMRIQQIPSYQCRECIHTYAHACMHTVNSRISNIEHTCIHTHMHVQQIPSYQCRKCIHTYAHAYYE
jgi:hypothetical protein